MMSLTPSALSLRNRWGSLLMLCMRWSPGSSQDMQIDLVLLTHLSWWMNHNWSTTRSQLLTATLHSDGLISADWLTCKHSTVTISSPLTRLMGLRCPVFPVRYVWLCPSYYLTSAHTWHGGWCFDEAVESDIVDHCVRNWQVALPDNLKSMFLKFDETGIFVAICWHGFILTCVDMICSGELWVILPHYHIVLVYTYKSKYPLVILCFLLELFSNDQALVYNIGCAFKVTARKNPIL